MIVIYLVSVLPYLADLGRCALAALLRKAV